MDVRTGKVVSPEEYQRLLKKYGPDHEKTKYLKPMNVTPTPKQIKRKPPKVGRNELCPCGSGKKFKRCCLLSKRERMRIRAAGGEE